MLFSHAIPRGGLRTDLNYQGEEYTEKVAIPPSGLGTERCKELHKRRLAGLSVYIPRGGLGTFKKEAEYFLAFPERRARSPSHTAGLEHYCKTKYGTG